MGDNCICVLNEKTNSISQKSGPFQKPTWEFYSFLSILFILIVIKMKIFTRKKMFVREETNHDSFFFF